MDIQQLVQTDQWKAFMRKLEIMGYSVLAIALILKTAGIQGAGVALTLSLGTLSVCSFFMAFGIFKSESVIISQLFLKSYGFGLAFGYNSILFIYQHWPMPPVLLLVSMSLLLIALILGYREKRGENPNRINWIYFTRIAIIMVLIIVLLKDSEVTLF